MTERRKGELLILGAATLWSMGGALAKLIDLPGPTMAGYRALFAAAALLPFLRRDRISFSPIMILMVVCFTLMNVSYVTAITLTTAANAIFLQYTAPVWMFLGSVFWLREPVEKSSLAGLAFGLTGIAVLLAGQAPAEGPGILLGVVSGMLYAGVVLCLRRLRDHDAFWLTFLNHAFAGLVTLALLLLVPRVGPVLVSPGHLLGLAVFGVVQLALPYVAFSKGVRYVTPQEAGVLSLLEPVLNPVLAFLAVGEVPSRWTIIGGAIILVGLFIRYVAPQEESSPALPQAAERNGNDASPRLQEEGLRRQQDN